MPSLSRALPPAVFLAVLAPAAAAELVAERITPESVEALRVGGPDADGAVGDWALQNGTLCAVISDVPHESPMSPQGGALADLVRCGRANDQWSALLPLLNLSRSPVVPVGRISAEHDARTARITVEGGREGLRFRTSYALDLVTPEELSVTTELTRSEGGDRVFAFGEVALHASGQLRPFSLLTRDLARSVGFEHPSGDPSSPLTMLKGIVASDAHVLVGGELIEPGLAYGIVLRRAELRRASGASEPVATMSITGESFTLTGVFAQPFWFESDGAPGLLQLAQLAWMDLAPGDVLVIERTIRVGERADVASVTDALFEDGVPVTGHVDDAGARIHVTTASGAPITEARPEPDGAFSFRLPPGSYRARAVAPGGREAVREFALSEEPLTLAPIALAAMGRLHVPCCRSSRLVFVGLDGTATPRFGDDLLGFRVAEQAIPSGPITNALSLHPTPEGTLVPLAPGRYRVFATRGIAAELAKMEIEVRSGETTALEFADPPGGTQEWIAADLHVHSAESFDSSWPLDRQLVAFAANGAEVLVSSEHDRIFDPRPAIQRLDLGHQLIGVVGVEITTAFTGGDSPYTIGHLNAFPLERDALAWRGGAPRAEGRRVRSVLADLGRGPDAPFVQMNHPRAYTRDAVDGEAYFTHLAVAGEPYDPTQSLDAEPNRVLMERDPGTGLRDLDFDGIELMNGPSMDRYRLVRADWFSLLLQGVYRVGVANSDSHRAGQLPALPRTYVAHRHDPTRPFDARGFFAALRAGRAFGTTGPLPTVRLGDAGPGERFTGSEGVLRVGVWAASWVPVDSLRVYRDGVLVARRSIAPMMPVEIEIPLSFERDAFVTVEVEGAPDEIWSVLAPGFTPFAFTNPIFVDADRDGTWTAPGLPDDPPPALADPLRSALREETP